VTEAQNADPEVLNKWIPAVHPERLRRIRLLMVVSLLAAWGIFLAGLLGGAWSVSKGFPDILILRAHTHVRQALAKTRAIREKHPSRVESLTLRPSEAKDLADVLDLELGDIRITHLYPVGKL
jgi:Tfp pilus assembly protein PilN